MTEPADLELFRSNIKLFSFGWPAGALEACYDLMDRHPGWRVMWFPPNPFRPGSPAEYRALLDTPFHSVQAMADDPEKLAEKMASVPEHDYDLRGCSWCYSHLADARPVEI